MGTKRAKRAWTERVRVRRAVVAAAVLAATPAIGATAISADPVDEAVTGATTRTLDGHIRDPWGDPMGDAIVYDRNDPTYQTYGYPLSAYARSDAAGYYAARLTPGDHALHYEHPLTEAEPRDVRLLEDTRIDVTLPYLLRVEERSRPVSVDLSSEVMVARLTSWAPRPGTAGGAARTSCAWGQADGQAPSPAAFAGTGDYGEHTFDWTHEVSQGTPDGTYGFTAWLADCADPDLVLSRVQPGTYEVRSSPMAVVDHGPTEPTLGVARLSFTTTHDMVESTVMVDGALVSDREPSPASRVEVLLTDLAEGLHTATVSGTDRDGRATAPVTFSWLVDETAPLLDGGSPRGVISNRLQKLTVLAHDELSGISDRYGAPRFVVTDPQGGIRSYPAVAEPGGWYTAKADPFLRDGEYKVVFRAWDAAGNGAERSWRFEMRGLAFLLRPEA